MPPDDEPIEMQKRARANIKAGADLIIPINSPDKVDRSAHPALKEYSAAMTRVSAEICGVPDRGTIEAGRLADLVVLEGNPLEDIRALRQVRGVIKGGEVVHWYAAA